MNMRRKNIVGVMVFVFLILIWIVCLIVGYRIGVNGYTPELIWEKTIDVETIAVVNLDEGIYEDGEFINYSKDLLDFSNENLLNTSLEDARKGVEDGTYAGYVVIPATFSESVNSINGLPLESQIQYALCDKLSSQSGLQAMSNIYILINSLNDNVSYMYIDGILNEFHNVQDGSVEILENDKNAQTIIDGVQPEDIKANVDIPIGTQIEYTPESIDYSAYLNNNIDTIQEINQLYEDNLSKSKEDKKALSDEAQILGSCLLETNEKIKNIDIETDKDGNYVYDTELTNLKDQLNTYNDSIDSNMSILQNATNDSTGTIVKGKETLNDVIQDYSDTIDWYNEELSDQIDNLNNMLVSGKYQMNLTGEDFVITKNNGANQAGCVDVVYSDAQIITYQLVDSTGMINTMVLYQLINELLENGKVRYMISSGGTVMDIQTSSGILNSISQFDKTKLYEKREDGSYTEKDTDLKSQIDEVNGELSVLQRTLQQFEDDTKKIDTDNIVDGVKEQVVTKLSNNAKDVSEMVRAQYGSGVTGLSSFQEKLNAYDPFSYIDQNKIGEKKENLNQNTGILQITIEKKDSSDSEMMNSIYEQYSENVSNLETSIMNAMESSNQALETGLQDAKESLSTNSIRNQELLVEFGKKLPNTRNGKLDNYSTYQFIVSPCEGMDISQHEEKSDPVMKENEGSTDWQKKSMLRMVFLIVLISFVITLMGVSVYKKKIVKNYNL